MPRQRMVKPDFFDSGSLAECSRSARLAFIGLWVMGDDNGNVKFSVRKLKKQIFPFDDMPDADFVSLLAELERVGCIKAYEVDGEEYVSTVNFKVYQTVKNPSRPRFRSLRKASRSSPARAGSRTRSWSWRRDAPRLPDVEKAKDHVEKALG